MKRLSSKEIKYLKKTSKICSLNSLVKITGIPKSTIYYHVKNNVRKVSKFNINKLDEWERGYIVGLFISDGTLHFDKEKYRYIIRFFLNNKSEWKIARRIMNILGKSELRSHANVYKGNRLVVSCYSKILYTYLNSFVFYKRINGRRKKFDMIDMTEYSRLFKLGFIASYIDGDGYIGPDKSKNVRVLISTSRKRIAIKLKSVLESIDIKNTLQHNRKRDQYFIRLSTPFYLKEANNLNCVKGR